MPYSENAVVTEYFDVGALPGGGQVLMVTTIVEDPRYLFVAVHRQLAVQEGNGWCEMGSLAMLRQLVAARPLILGFLALCGAVHA